MMTLPEKEARFPFNYHGNEATVNVGLFHYLPTSNILHESYVHASLFFRPPLFSP